MSIAPEPILTAGMEVVHQALVCCRNWTLTEMVSRRQINELMEAVHEILAMLMRWGDGRLDELKTHLSGFRAERWRACLDEPVWVPDLLGLFERRVEEAGS